MLSLTNVKTILVNNAVFVKKENGKWCSATAEMWEDTFLNYCAKANSVEILEKDEPKKKKVDKKHYNTYKIDEFGLNMYDDASKSEEK